MNKRNLESREVRLGLIHVAGLLGLTVGCIAASFCLGYLAGSKVGFERESNTILAELPKFPVGGEGAGDDAGEKIANEVYAKLNEQSAQRDAHGDNVDSTGPGDSSKIPELASIPDVRPEGIPADSVAIETGAGIVPKGDSREVPAGDVKVIDTSKAPDRHESLAAVKERERSPGLMPEQSEKKAPAGEVIGGSDVKEPVTLGSLIPKKGETTLDAGNVQKVKPVPTLAVVLDHQKEVKEEKTNAIADLKTSVPEKRLNAGGVVVSKTIPTGWFAQVAAPKRLEDASTLAQSLKRSGFAVTIESAQVRGEDYYRVLVGPETARSQAEILLKQLKREPYVKGEPFIRMVK